MRKWQEARETGSGQILEGFYMSMVRSLVHPFLRAHTCHRFKALLSIACMCLPV